MAELNEDERLALKRAKLFEELIAGDAWKEFEAILRAQREMHLGNVLSPAEGGMDGITHVLRAEFAKGAAFGLAIAVSTPLGVISTAKHILTENPQKEFDTNVKRSTPGNPEHDTQLADGGPDTIVTDLG